MLLCGRHPHDSFHVLGLGRLIKRCSAGSQGAKPDLNLPSSVRIIAGCRPLSNRNPRSCTVRRVQAKALFRRENPLKAHQVRPGEAVYTRGLR